MANAATWRGAIEFAGFPVNIALYPRKKSRSGESFKMLAPNGNPVKTLYVDSDGIPIDSANIGRGVEIAKGQYAALSVEALEQIKSADKSTVLSAAYYAPLDSLPLELAIQAYTVTPDDKVPGADRSANVIWNGLRANELAYVTQAVFRSGERDAVIVIWADDNGLKAVSLPFEQELWPAQETSFTADDKQAQMFARFVQADQIRPYDQGAHQSEYKQRRQQVIDAVLAGEQVQAPEPTAGEQVPDLMAALEASLKAVAA